MLQLSALALDWGANLVETTVFQSFIFGIEGIYPRDYCPNTRSNASTLRLFEVYNSTLLNSHIHKMLSNDVSMDTFEVFLRKAARDVTLVHFSTEHSTSPHVRRISPNSTLDLLAIKFAFSQQIYIADCSTPKLKGFTQLIERVEHYLNGKLVSLLQQQDDPISLQMSKPFKVTKVLCLNPKYTYTSETLSKYVTLPGTVIFTNWLGCCSNECTIHNFVANHPLSGTILSKSKSTCNKNLRFSVPTNQFYAGRVKDAQFLHHSRIKYAALRQLDYVGINPQRKGYVSVHIRVERIIRTAVAKSKLWARNKLDFLEKCVGKVLRHLKELRHGSQLTNELGTRTTLWDYLLVTDVGDRGTNSLTKPALRNDAQLFLKVLKSHGVQVHHCNLDLLRVRDAQNSGYVSLVEMTMLALGRKLLLVGGGGFQVNIAQKFHSLHGKKRDVLRESCAFA